MVVLRAAWIIFKDAFTAFLNSDVMSHAAGIAFYTALGLAPTVLLFLSIASFVDGVGQQSLINEINRLVGPEAAEGVKLVIENAEREQRRRQSGLISTIISIGTFLFSSSAVFAQLQVALNNVWRVMPRPDSGMLDFLRKRLISVGMVLGMMLLMLASLVISAMIPILVPWGEAWQVLNVGISMVVFTACFGMIFKFLPDAKITWRDVFAGAAMTALLFSLGKWAIGLYLGNSSVGSAYGMAGSLIVLLVWVYYSAIIILFGAEMTQAYARHFGGGIHPDRYAMRVEPPKPVEAPSES